MGSTKRKGFKKTDKKHKFREIAVQRSPVPCNAVDVLLPDPTDSKESATPPYPADINMLPELLSPSLWATDVVPAFIDIYGGHRRRMQIARALLLVIAAALFVGGVVSLNLSRKGKNNKEPLPIGTLVLFIGGPVLASVGLWLLRFLERRLRSSDIASEHFTEVNSRSAFSSRGITFAVLKEGVTMIHSNGNRQVTSVPLQVSLVRMTFPRDVHPPMTWATHGTLSLADAARWQAGWPAAAPGSPMHPQTGIMMGVTPAAVTPAAFAAPAGPSFAGNMPPPGYPPQGDAPSGKLPTDWGVVDLPPHHVPGPGKSDFVLVSPRDFMSSAAYGRLAAVPPPPAGFGAAGASGPPAEVGQGTGMGMGMGSPVMIAVAPAPGSGCGSMPAPGYPAAVAGYPLAAPGYPTDAPGYATAQAAPGYPGAVAGYSAAAPGYPAAAPSYPAYLQAAAETPVSKSAGGSAAVVAPQPQPMMSGVPIAWPMPSPQAADPSPVPAGAASADPSAPPPYSGAAAMPLAAPYAAPPPQPRMAAL